MCHQTLWPQMNATSDEGEGRRYEADQLQEHLHLD